MGTTHLRLAASPVGVREVQFNARVTNNKTAKAARKPSVVFSAVFAERQRTMERNS